MQPNIVRDLCHRHSQSSIISSPDRTGFRQQCYVLQRWIGALTDVADGPDDGVACKRKLLSQCKDINLTLRRATRCIVKEYSLGEIEFASYSLLDVLVESSGRWEMDDGKLVALEGCRCKDIQRGKGESVGHFDRPECQIKPLDFGEVGRLAESYVQYQDD